jgi:hypothetical protein
MKSSTLIADPNVALLKMLTELPRRAMLRKLIDDPIAI